jgi:hypothetical protein
MTEIDDIVRAIEQDRVVFVVGSGMSRLAGLPTGQELASQLNESFQLGLARPECDDLQKVSMLIECQSGRSSLVDAVIAALNRPSTEVSQAHRTLVKIARKIVTTNYDRVIENAACKSVPAKELKVIKRPADCSSLTPPFLIKSHGCITDKETIVVTSVDYLKCMEETKFRFSGWRRTLCRTSPWEPTSRGTGVGSSRTRRSEAKCYGLTLSLA